VETKCLAWSLLQLERESPHQVHPFSHTSPRSLAVISPGKMLGADLVECENGVSVESVGKSWEEFDGKKREGEKGGLYRQWGFQVRRCMSVITIKTNRTHGGERTTPPLTEGTQVNTE